MLLKKAVLSGVIILSGIGVANALTDKEVQESKQALKYLDEKDYNAYYRYKAKLKNTSIYPYLKYKEISSNPAKFSQKTIDAYLSDYKGQYWSAELKDNLATYYAGESDWQLFNKYYDGSLGISGKCWQMQSQYEQGDKSKALESFAKIWQNKVYVPKACMPMNKYWDDNLGIASDSYIINKAYTLAFAGKYDDALWLVKKYVKNNSDYVNYLTAWHDVIKHPKDLDNFIAKYHKYRHFNDIFVDISKDLIKKDAEGYAKLWDSLKHKNMLNTKVKHKCISLIAVSFARSQSSEAKQWLSRVDTKYLDSVAWEWILRVDLYNSNYEGYIKDYAKLPDKLKQEDAWKYWLAYSYKETDEEQKAKPIFEDLTKESLEYYSFLAADELGQPYNYGNVNDNNLSVAQKKGLLSNISVKQTMELYQIGEYKDSTSIWKWYIRDKLKKNEKTQIKQLAKLMEQQNMYYAAIFNMAVVGKYSDVNLLFPDAFDKEVTKASKKYGIDKSLILSVMRKESLFDVEAGSWAGAKGLMQLTLPTADFISKKYKINLVGGSRANMDTLIYVPANNITLGTANLYFLDTLFDKNVVLGLAAYNAGPGNVAKWLTPKKVPTPVWIESIPFGETRHYIRKILVYMATYNNFVLGEKEIRLKDFLDAQISDEMSFRK